MGKSLRDIPLIRTTSMSSFHEQLLGLFPAQQLEALDKVKAELLRNPDALDTHSKKEKK